ncbi:MAG: class I SAM-dependent RNA methyltransferase [Rhodobacteraceae bacterium]|nr:class I SAM-dependent RNA methyltransferase [Paracoccaceae bacterium]
MILTVSRLGHLGDGVAEGPEGPVYVPGALPGERVEGAVAGGRMAAPRIVEPSALRVKAPCPHYRACGGCSLMHARDEFVVEWKAGVVRAALAAQGIEAPLPPVLTMPARSRRRATFHGRRTKKGALVGFHGRASGALVAVPGCLLVTPALVATLPALEALVAAGGSRTGELALTVTETEGGPDVAVEGGKPPDAALRRELAALAPRFALARLTWNGETLALRAAPELRFGPARVTLPPGAFLQATAEGEAALVAAVAETVGGARRIVDLFAGAGTFALPLAGQAEVHAVEGEAEMVAALERGWRAAGGLRRLTAEARDLFRRPLLPDELARFDAAVIDPPRAGAEAQVTELSRSGLGRIAYVSCNPVSFARDARILVSAGFRLDRLKVIDQFRWSPHIELAAAFVRDHMAR